MNAPSKLPIQKFINPDSNTLHTHSLAGEKDGKNNIPASDSEAFSLYEQGVINDVKGSWNKYKENTNEIKSDLEKKINSLSQEIDQKLPDQVEQIEKEKIQEYENLSNTKGPKSITHNDLRERHETAKNQLNELRLRLGRPLEIHFETFYYPILIALMFGEVGINKMAFEGLFSSGGPFPFILAATVGAIFLITAHTSGKSLKQLDNDSSAFTASKTYISVSIFLIIMVFIMYGLAKARQALFNLDSDDNLTGALLGDQNLADALGSVTQTTLGEQGYFMFGLNVAIFAVGLLISFHRWDPNSGYETIVTAEKKISEKYLKYQQDYEQEVSLLTKSYEGKTAYFSLRRNEARQELETLKTEIEKLDSDLKNTHNQLTSGLKQVLLAYFKANETSRSVPTPAYFNSLNEEKMRSVLD